MKQTGCQCDGAGWCELLQRQMSPARFKECSTKPEFHELFLREAGISRHRGLGDIVAATLRFVGITPERVGKLTGKDCGCKKRQQQLNELGNKLFRANREHIDNPPHEGD